MTRPRSPWPRSRRGCSPAWITSRPGVPLSALLRAGLCWASSHDFVLVSAHPPGSACAGCAPPRDEDITGEIPTISFASLWAGLILAIELAAAAVRPPPRP
jgi:hypothetical protein